MMIIKFKFSNWNPPFVLRIEPHVFLKIQILFITNNRLLKIIDDLEFYLIVYILFKFFTYKNVSTVIKKRKKKLVNLNKELVGLKRFMSLSGISFKPNFWNPLIKS